jgi:hypothetical protein
MMTIVDGRVRAGSFGGKSREGVRGAFSSSSPASAAAAFAEEKWAAMVWREGDLEKEGAREPATLPPKLEPFEVRLVRPAEREVKVE